MEGCKVVMWGWGRLEAGVLWVVRMAGLVEMEVEPPPQSESSMFPPLLHPAPHPFCNLHRHVVQVRPDSHHLLCTYKHTHLSQLLMSQV